MAYYNTTFLGSLSTGNVYVASAGLTNVVFKAQPSESIVSSATEVAVGLYQWLVPDTSYAYKLYVNGNVVSSWGGSTGKYIPTTDLSTITYVDYAVSNRVDRAGDTLIGPYYLTYAPTGNGMDVILMTGGNVSSSAIPSKGYVDLMINAVSSSLSGISSSTASLTSTYVTLATTQSPIGDKTWSGTHIWDIGTSTTASPKYQIQMSSNPPNGGIVGLVVGYQGNNKMLFNYKDSDMFFNGGITATATAMLSNPKIPTNSTKYIVGNPVNNDFVWKKWVSDNFTPLAGGYNSYTIIIDPTAPVVLGKQYPNINDAINDIAPSLSTTERYTLLVKQPDEGVYLEDVEVPDWLNIIGEGQIKIFGQLTRTGASPDISSKLENLYFFNSIAGAHDVDRFHCVNCVFEVNGDVVLTDSICNSSGFYGSTITSGNGNRIMNCFGNQLISWKSTDKVYSCNILLNDSYAY